MRFLNKIGRRLSTLYASPSLRIDARGNLQYSSPPRAWRHNVGAGFYSGQVHMYFCGTRFWSAQALVHAWFLKNLHDADVACALKCYPTLLGSLLNYAPRHLHPALIALSLEA